jgi:hypothetical protein
MNSIKLTILLTLTCLSFTIKPADDIHSKPELVLGEVFIAAQTGNFSLLTKLCDPENLGDGDTKRICDIENASEEKKAEFKLYFSKASIVSKPIIEGDTAKIKIKFGPNGDLDEEFNLVRRDNKWYLFSF